MKKILEKAACLSLVLAMSLCPDFLARENNLMIVSEAHPGRTDANGGHRDNKNKSGLGNYHYHCGGNPAHLHPDGVCPYASQASATAMTYNIPQEAAKIKETAAPEPVQISGWQQDSSGWRYKESEDAYYKNGRYFIEGCYYLFDANGYMLTGWQESNENWYYFDSSGHMIIGQYFIDGDWEYFDYDGAWIEDYYDDYDDDYGSNYDCGDDYDYGDDYWE